MFILKRLEVYRAFGFERIDKILRMQTSHSSVECLPTSRVKAFLIITVDEKALNVHTLYTYTPARKAAGNRIAVFFLYVFCNYRGCKPRACLPYFTENK